MHAAVSPHNKHRVTIDVGQDAKDGSRRPRPVGGDGAVAPDLSTSAARITAGQTETFTGGAAETERLSQLAQLGQLHRQGVLTDAEFAAQKAQILGQN